MIHIIIFLYEILILVGIACYIPVYLARGKFNLWAYCAKLTLRGLPNDSCESLWIQAVSVGEVLSLKQFIPQLKKVFPHRIVISTTTLTGYSVATQHFSSEATIVYFPFDITFSLRRFIARINPKIFIAVETEIWPNLLFMLKRRSIPCVILNGRISDRAFAQYRRVRFFIKRIVAMMTTIGVQSEHYRERFLALGANEASTVVSGNMKFASLARDEEKLTQYKNRYLELLKRGGRLLLIGASTHDPEEEIIITIYKELAKKFRLSLLLAPRHPERAVRIQKMCREHELVSVMFKNGELNQTDASVFILDTTGELFYFYDMADICFVGGSLVDYGGHNILEPVYFYTPTLFGPFMNNFQEIEEIVIRERAAIKVHDQHHLKEELAKLLGNPSLRMALAKQCRNVFRQEGRLLEKNIEIITRALMV